jgi:hypothetical protein
LGLYQGRKFDKVLVVNFLNPSSGNKMAIVKHVHEFLLIKEKHVKALGSHGIVVNWLLVGIQRNGDKRCHNGGLLNENLNLN